MWDSVYISLLMRMYILNYYLVSAILCHVAFFDNEASGLDTFVKVKGFTIVCDETLDGKIIS